MLPWFATSRTGQTLAAVFIALALVAVALLKAFSAGQARERLKGVESNLNAVRERRRVGSVVARPRKTGVG
jgi:type II secretory pathway component PulJ